MRSRADGAAEADPRQADAADVVVTMGCGDECPYIPGNRHVDWDLPDPKGLPLDLVRELRLEIDRTVHRLVGQLDAGTSLVSSQDD